MTVCFLTISQFDPSSYNIYTCLIQYFHANGHSVTVICPTPRCNGLDTQINEENGIRILRVKTLNLVGQCGLLEKGVGMILLENQFIHAIKKYLPQEQFDCILYSTPPITLARVIRYLKKKNNALTYLLLKDIMPQGAVDLGLFPKYSPPWFYFRLKEKQLYTNSDYIGCMSTANCEYVLRHNNFIKQAKLEVNPNSIMPRFIKRDRLYLAKFKIPKEKIVFLYGGNLGRPQGVKFIFRCLASNELRNNTYFVIAGTGSERNNVKQFFEKLQPRNSILLPYLPRDEFEKLCAACDVGLVFLDGRFTFPNFPSRILSYMQASIPYIAAVDSKTDVGTIAETNKFGLNCLWGDLVQFNRCVEQLADNPVWIQKMGKNARQYFLDNYTVKKSYQTIMRHFQRNDRHSYKFKL